jgi:hypothetical protein
MIILKLYHAYLQVIQFRKHSLESYSCCVF